MRNSFAARARIVASHQGHETFRPDSPAVAVRHLGRQLSVHPHRRAGAGAAADGVLPRADRRRHAGGLPDADESEMGHARQVAPGDRAGHHQLGHPVRDVFGGRALAAGRLFGHLQRHDAADGRADRQSVLRRETDARQGAGGADRTGRGGGAYTHRPGGVLARGAARRAGLPGGDLVLRVGRIPDAPLDHRARRAG
ncbi:hypothetical protein D3C86_1632020 [compost metagenome]